MTDKIAGMRWTTTTTTVTRVLGHRHRHRHRRRRPGGGLVWGFLLFYDPVSSILVLCCRGPGTYIYYCFMSLSNTHSHAWNMYVYNVYDDCCVCSRRMARRGRREGHQPRQPAVCSTSFGRFYALQHPELMVQASVPWWWPFNEWGIWRGATTRG